MSARQTSDTALAVAGVFRLDTAQLERWMTDNIEGFAGPVALRQFAGGQSNPTYLIETPGRDYVLRRKPPGPILKGAHAVEREARVMSGLAWAGYPVPRVYGLCTDDDVIGTWFYIMEMVEGRVFSDVTLAKLPVAERRAYFDAMNATLARLHCIEPARCGLEDYGRIGGYVARQIHIWTKQYEAMTDEAGRVPDIERIVPWLKENLPDDGETRIAHGDFRIDNLIFHAERPEVIAVLDWELSTLGDPLADFAYNAMMYRMPHDLRAGLAGLDVAALGLPGEAEYVQAYCARTGRDGIPELDYYIAFNIFRFAAICHGIRGRLARGNAAAADAQILASSVERLAELAWQQAERFSGRGAPNRAMRSGNVL